MKIIVSNTNDPFFNIASEEYILKNFTEDIFFLYINSPSVICGKHQNPIAETNYAFISKNNIPIIRRLSGGGAVYHDLGNLNFCFIQTSDNQKLVDFKKFSKPIIEVLNSLNLNAVLGNKNEINIQNLKVSGNAEHIWKNKVMHHGTLLLNSDLNNLQEALSQDGTCFIGHSVKSNRGNVTNINSHLKPPITMVDFIKKIIEYVKKINQTTIEYNLSSLDIIEINKLIKNKYSTWEWNYGYTSDYTFVGKIMVDQKIEEIEFVVKKGIIVSFKTSNHIIDIHDLLIGKAHYEIQNLLIFKK